MPDVDLSSLSIDELKLLSVDIDKEIQKRQQQNKKNVLSEMKQLAASIGMTVEQILESASQTKAKGTPKFKNPSDPTQTWTGRGKRPGWLNDALQAGKTLDELRI